MSHLPFLGFLVQGFSKKENLELKIGIQSHELKNTQTKKNENVHCSIQLKV